MRSARRKIVFPASRDRLNTSRSSSLARQVKQKMHVSPLQADPHAGSTTFDSAVPSIFTRSPTLKDKLTTKTSIHQDETVWECLPYLKGIDDPGKDPFDFNEHGVLRLNRDEHIEYLKDHLGNFPAAYVSVDASRPWIMYWGLMGLYLLGEDVTDYRARVIRTVLSMQHPAGGFGGGNGQYSHLAGSYACLLSIALVGGHDAYELVNRRKLWEWLGRLKQNDGGFEICEGGEEDVRGAYCAMVVISLLDLPFELPLDAPARKKGLRTFGDGLGDYLSRCQTYEGGLSAAPGTEAHGSYAFCALACLCLLDDPQRAMTQYLDMNDLLSWLSSRQYAPEGGFAGRTNKLVDGCYSHWLGGCWPLAQAALAGPQDPGNTQTPAIVGMLLSREGLTRYVLNCCQAKDGGLRDKPSKRPDSYHTCYTLAGLSAIQHSHYYECPKSESLFASAFTWKWTKSMPLPTDRDVFDEEDMVNAFHPVYAIPHDAVLAIRRWAESQERL